MTPPGGPTWVWTITDKHDSTGEREHVVLLQSDPQLGHIVDTITLKAFGGADALYNFEYDIDNVENCYKREAGSGNPTAPFTPLLAGITLPESAGSYDFTDGSGNARYHKIGCVSSLPGALLGMRLPTRGQVEWDYGGYLFPAERAGTASVGVKRRRTLDHAGTLEGQWFYENETASYDVGQGDQPLETRTHITYPTGDCTKHYFSAEPNDTAWQYGLPFSNREPGIGSLKISTEVFESNSGGASPTCSGSVLRTSYVEYEPDAPAPINPNNGRLDVYNVNRRLLTARTDFDDNRHAETAMSDFDGLGHYRTTETAGDFPSGNVREVFTDYNPDLGTYNPNGHPGWPAEAFSPPSHSDPWVLGTFGARETTEGDTARELFCFVPSTGFLLWRRTLVDPPNPGNDVVAFFDPGGSGNISEEFHYGGDVAGAPSIDCPASGEPLPSPPSGETYRLDHRYQHGVLRRTRYLDAGGGSLGFWVLDRDIDQSTGLIAASRDTAEIQTTFTYDRLDRLTRSEPPAAQGAATQYTYTAASGATPAQINITQQRNPGGSSLASSIVLFDGLGRVTGELRQLPSGSFNRRNTSYNERGWKSSVSELEPSTPGPTNFTQLLDYDPFGRPGRIVAPDGHEVLLDYSGVSKVERTVTVGFGSGPEMASTTTEEFDRQGRLWRVTEPAGVSGAPVTTTYGYDEGNRLDSVSMTDGATAQQRLFDYDKRGFLQSEQHPEKGVSGNGTVTYGAYDARGHAGQKVDGSNDLEFEYDRAERLLAVRDLSSGRMEKEFAYASDNDPGPPFSYRQGKLERVTRHNYLTAFGNTDVEISEVYAYGGVGGRVSKRVIERGDGGATPVPFFAQEFSWTELGDLDELTYPSCVIAAGNECTGNPGPAKVVDHNYVNGFLTGITGYATIGYHANEMLASIAHANGVTEVWDQDPDSMRGPARIRTTGVTGGQNFDTGSYAYDGAGNVTAMGADAFTYDEVSRLATGSAMGGQVSESYEYDAFGNRIRATTSSIGHRGIPTDPTTNRLLDTPERPVTYDDRGNVSEWGSADYQYDPFDMLSRHDDGARNLTYVYTADDERIITIVHPPSAVSETWTLRDLDATVLREFFRSPSVDATWQKDTVQRQGQVLATHTAAGRRDAHLDHLGTIRLWTGPSGSSPIHHTYHAFGEEVMDTADGQALRFTGHERDLYASGGCSGTTTVNGETITTGKRRFGCDELTSDNTTIATPQEVRFVAGDRVALSNFTVQLGSNFVVELDGYLNSDNQDLDYMHARYCSPGIGRFLSVDPAGESADPRKPQSWNRYSYVQNRPLSFIDPTGEILFFFSSSDDNLEELEGLANQDLVGVDLVIGQTGKASLVANNEFGPPTPEQAAFADVLQTAIDSTSNIGLNVTRNDPMALVGNLLGDIDIADMAMLQGTISGFAGALAHEVAEQSFLQTLSPRPSKDQLRTDPSRPSHLAGIAAQSAAAGARRIRTTATGQLRAIDFSGGKSVTFIVRDGNIIKVVK